MQDWAIQAWGSVTTMIANTLDISSQAKSALLGAIVGSLVGGLINYCLARRSTRLEAEKRDADRREVRKAKAQSLMVKLIRVSTFARNMHLHLDECRNRRPDKPLSWEVVTPVSNLPQAFSFDAEEVVAVMSIKSDVLANQVLDIEFLFNGLLEGMRNYQQTRKEVAGQLSARLNGRMASAEITPDTMMKVGEQLVEMNMVLESLEPMSIRLWALCQNALPSLLKALRREFGITTQIDFRTEPSKEPVFREPHRKDAV